MKTLTVFTPAYNRARTIGRTYESLCRQTLQDFEWLVVDDGSSDNTRELVEGWIKENRIPIKYIYQENQGMHGAHNTAYKNIYTELNICIDSDDYLPDDAVEKIVDFWEKLTGAQQSAYAGFVGLDYTQNGRLIGTDFKNITSPIHFYKSGIKGDKKIVLRTELAKKYPAYPVFEGEKYVGLGYKIQLIDQDYKWLTLNEPLVIVDYQLEDGSSYNMYRQWWNNPKGFAFIHNTDLLYVNSFRRKIIVSIHYVSHCIRAGRICDITRSNNPLLTTLCVLPGTILFLHTWYKVHKESKLKLKL